MVLPFLLIDLPLDCALVSYFAFDYGVECLMCCAVFICYVTLIGLVGLFVYWVYWCLVLLCVIVSMRYCLLFILLWFCFVVDWLFICGY